MESKYYEPDVEDFYVGMIYETEQDELRGIWEENTINTLRELEELCKYNSKYIGKYSNIRVKHLNREDIESFGFKKSNKNSWIGYKDYFLDSINPEYPYFLFATIHIPIRDDMYKILVHRYYNEDEPIDEDDNYSEPTCVYVGKIKNKSELNQLLKRLNIINE